MLACIWLRTLLNEWIYFINVASVLAAFIDPLQCNIVSLVCTNWFETHQQIVALTTITLFSVLGPIGGSFYSLIYIDTGAENISAAKDMMFHATFYIALTYSCIYIPSILLFRGKPEYAPWYLLTPRSVAQRRKKRRRRSRASRSGSS